ncbi:UvrD/REP helicase [Bacteroidales bacterium KA00344]|nr:UvrD/REP helicase [Bacteroidales bacterium KA00344]
MQTDQELLTQLNDSQREAVEYCDGPQLVIAGAGSGKTRVLTYKIAWLLEHYGMKPWNILALTFTNKAAREMKQRIGQLVGEERARHLQMGTFHSVFSRILRVEAQSIGYNSDYTIYDETDSRSLIKNIVKTMGLDDKSYKPASVHSAISMAKNRLCMPSQYAEDGDLRNRDRHRNMPEIYKIYMSYQQRLRQANAMDFDDLLVLTYRMLQQDESLRKKYAERFQYVFVDEYQDTNFAQQQIVTLLTKEHRRICVVGDDYQSIYAFRGAKIDNILNFNKIYPEAKLFKLEQNYRSTQLIVAAANSLMKHNSRQIPKEVFSKNEEGEKLTVFETISDKREAAMVCREIKRIKCEENCRWSDFAILYRTNAQSRTFEEEMRKPEVDMGKHYRIYGGLSFYQRKEIKDIIAYFRMVVNPDDEEAFRRIINYPTRGIGATTLQKIIDTAQQYHVSFWEVVCKPIDFQLDVNKGTLGKLSAFQSLINGFMQKSKSTDAFTLGNEIIEQSGIKADLASDKTAEGDGRRQNVDTLLSGIADFVQGQREDDQAEHVGLSDYLSTVSLMTDIDSDDGSDDKLTMMTIHAAKGLEFPTVFIVGMEENIFPSTLSVGTPKELEEERRLLYVAITRAEKHCYLTWSHSRWLYGKMDSFVNPSRFLNDIDQKYITVRTESGRSSGRWFDNDNESVRRPWDDNYEINRPYMGSGSWNREYRRMSDRMQNSRPVAGQFMADAKPKETAPRRPETAVNPFSPTFEQKLKQSGRWKRVSQAMTNGGRVFSSISSASANPSSASPASSQGPVSGLQVGQIIEHHRFGRGTVIKVEGVGENAKATVEFDTTGRKQLLLKFARFNVIG